MHIFSTQLTPEDLAFFNVTLPVMNQSHFAREVLEIGRQFSVILGQKISDYINHHEKNLLIEGITSHRASWRDKMVQEGGLTLREFILSRIT
jgi:hypothetical protein